MGQAFRRASGRIRSSALDSSSSSPAQLKKTVDRRLTPASVDKVSAEKVPSGPVEEGESKTNDDNILEERDLQYDAMLSHMVGRIRSKPGGKHEMGEASMVERYSRPLPKLRNTKGESGRYEEKPAPIGTLNVAQVRQVILLYQGKAEDHDGPFNINQIAEKFRVDPEQIQRLVQHLSLPPESEDSNRHRNG